MRTFQHTPRRYLNQGNDEIARTCIRPGRNETRTWNFSRKP